VTVPFAEAVAPGGDYHWMFFTGGDLWHKGGFAHGGVLWSPDGLDREGFTLKVLLAGGTYYYDAGTTNVAGHQGLAAIMPGWRIKQDRLEIVFVAGPEVQHHGYGPDDTAQKLTGLADIRFGASPQLHAVLAARQLDADRFFTKDNAAEPVRALPALQALASIVTHLPIPAQIELASEQGQVDEWSRRVAIVRDLLSDPRVAAVLTNPTIPVEKRMGLISAAPNELDPAATNLARLLIESNRVRQVGGIAEEFETLADEAAGRVRATVTTAVEGRCTAASAAAGPAPP